MTSSQGLRCGDNNCRELVTRMYQGPGKQHMDGETLDKEYLLLIPCATGFQGYSKEVEAIFDEDDDCCYDPNNDSVILGASGIFNPVKYFNSSTYIYIK